MSDLRIDDLDLEWKLMRRVGANGERLGSHGKPGFSLAYDWSKDLPFSVQPPIT